MRSNNNRGVNDSQKLKQTKKTITLKNAKKKNDRRHSLWDN